LIESRELLWETIKSGQTGEWTKAGNVGLAYGTMVGFLRVGNWHGVLFFALELLKTALELDGLGDVNPGAFALGVYVENEGKKLDEWRTAAFDKLRKHLEHEVFVEVQRDVKSSRRELLVHNAADAVCLAAMMVVRSNKSREVVP